MVRHMYFAFEVCFALLLFFATARYFHLLIFSLALRKRFNNLFDGYLELAGGLSGRPFWAFLEACISAH